MHELEDEPAPRASDWIIVWPMVSRRVYAIWTLLPAEKIGHGPLSDLAVISGNSDELVLVSVISSVIGIGTRADRLEKPAIGGNLWTVLTDEFVKAALDSGNSELDSSKPFSTKPVLVIGAGLWAASRSGVYFQTKELDVAKATKQVVAKTAAGTRKIEIDWQGAVIFEGELAGDKLTITKTHLCLGLETLVNAVLGVAGGVLHEDIPGKQTAEEPIRTVKQIAPTSADEVQPELPFDDEDEPLDPFNSVVDEMDDDDEGEDAQSSNRDAIGSTDDEPSDEPDEPTGVPSLSAEAEVEMMTSDFAPKRAAKSLDFDVEDADDEILKGVAEDAAEHAKEMDKLLSESQIGNPPPISKQKVAAAAKQATIAEQIATNAAVQKGKLSKEAAASATITAVPVASAKEIADGLLKDQTLELAIARLPGAAPAEELAKWTSAMVKRAKELETHVPLEQVKAAEQKRDILLTAEWPKMRDILKYFNYETTDADWRAMISHDTGRKFLRRYGYILTLNYIVNGVKLLSKTKKVPK